jgi:hypothetical protein
MSNITKTQADKTVKAKDMQKGDVVEGYLKSFVKTVNNFGAAPKDEFHPLFQGKDGKTTLVWKGGDITSAIKDALDAEEAPLGVYVKAKCLGMKGSFKSKDGMKTFNKFKIDLITDDVITEGVGRNPFVKAPITADPAPRNPARDEF